MYQNKMDGKLNQYQQIEDLFYKNDLMIQGIYKDELTGKLIMYEGMGKGADKKIERKCMSDTLDKWKAQAERAQQFLDIIRCTLKDCRYFLNDEDCSAYMQEDYLSFEVYNKNNQLVGFVKNMDFLLDKDFVYRQILKLCINRDAIPNKNAYYLELFHNGIIKPYINSDDMFQQLFVCGKYKWFFCISNALVNADVSILIS